MNSHSTDLILKVAQLISKRHIRKYNISIDKKVWQVGATLSNDVVIEAKGKDLEEALQNFDAMLQARERAQVGA